MDCLLLNLWWHQHSWKGERHQSLEERHILHLPAGERSFNFRTGPEQGQRNLVLVDSLKKKHRIIDNIRNITSTYCGREAVSIDSPSKFIFLRIFTSKHPANICEISWCPTALSKLGLCPHFPPLWWAEHWQTQWVCHQVSERLYIEHKKPKMKLQT